MKAIETAWAAGFFDGEGCSCGYTRSPKRRGQGKIALVVTQCGPDAPALLERFRQAIGGLGFVTCPRKPRLGYLDQYRWQTLSRDHACIIMQRLWPYLGPVKRRQFLAAMEKVKNGRQRQANA